MNHLRFHLNSYILSNINLYYKFIFYKMAFSKFFLLRLIIIRLKYDINAQFPYNESGPTQIKRFTILRSPHVHKKSREQFETRSYISNLFFRDSFNSCYYFSFLAAREFLKFLVAFRDCSVKALSQNFYVVSGKDATFYLRCC